MQPLKLAKSVARSADRSLRTFDRDHLSASLGIPYRPVFQQHIDQAKLVASVSDLFAVPQTTIEAAYKTYRALYDQNNYATTLGEFTTTAFEESFIIYTILSIARPTSLVEIGTQYGKSTRRIIDMTKTLGLNAKIRCFDISDDVQFFKKDEAELIIDDVTGAFRQKVLEKYQPQFIFMDAHPYALLKEVIGETIKSLDTCTIAIHDCGWGLCNPKPAIPKDRPELIGSRTGHWERHVLAEIFKVADPLDSRLDDLRFDGGRLRVFDTPHGLSVITKPRA